MDNERISKLFERRQAEVVPEPPTRSESGGLFDVGGRSFPGNEDGALSAIQRSFIATPEPAKREPTHEAAHKSIFDLAAEKSRGDRRMGTYEEELAQRADEPEVVHVKIGERVRDYRVLSLLGEGGMGTVYLAQHTMLGHKVAIKMLLPQFSDDQQYVKRLFLEAKVVTQIKHPSIVEVYDFGYHTNGSAFLVMEYLDGESLEERYAGRGKAPIAEGLHIVREVASALLVAHERGIIHRDLKPDNVFLVHDPARADSARVKILDFGLAKITNNSISSLVNTRTGSLMGTPAYMSPEQCRGTGNIDFRTDIYSLGCVLFRLITGRPPFVADTPADVLACHLREPAPSLRDFEPNVSLELAVLVQGALAKDPNDRYTTLEEFVSNVEAVEASYAGGREVTLPPPRSYQERAAAKQAAREAAPAPPPSVRAPTPAPVPEAARVRAATPLLDQGPDPALAAPEPGSGGAESFAGPEVTARSGGAVAGATERNRALLIAVIILAAVILVSALIFGLA